MQLKNDRLLKALRKQAVDTTPIWIMRQAGRYLPEYKKTRAQANDFLSLCRNADLACEVTLQPLRRFDLDAAILFSDILTIPDAMGLGLYFEAGEGPKFKKVIRSERDVQTLSVPSSGSLDYVYKAVETILSALGGRVPLLGFSGSPWTLATYMVEGGSSKDFRHIKSLLYTQPETLQQLLTLLTEAVTQYLAQQIKTGVHAIQIFDTWGGLLTTPHYLKFSLLYIQKIVETLKASYDIPIILYTKQGNLWLESMAEIGVDCLSLDWTITLEQAQTRVGSKVAIQGNLDPDVLFADSNCIRQAARSVLQQFTGNTGHIFNLGHGISQYVNPDAVKVLVDAVHEYKN